jgi:multicomponent Na+:H+ antiporter subunit D
MLAYSAIGQVGYVLVAIGIGGPIGFAAAVVYTVINAANKTMLFLTTGVRGGVIGGLFALGALSIAGVPPAGGFVGKLELFRAVFGVGLVATVVLLGSLLSFVYAFQIYQFEHWRPNGAATTLATWRDSVVPLALGIVILALGVWPEPLLALGRAAADVLAGGVR